MFYDYIKCQKRFNSRSGKYFFLSWNISFQNSFPFILANVPQQTRIVCLYMGQSSRGESLKYFVHERLAISVNFRSQLFKTLYFLIIFLILERFQLRYTFFDKQLKFWSSPQSCLKLLLFSFVKKNNRPLVSIVIFKTLSPGLLIDELIIDKNCILIKFTLIKRKNCKIQCCGLASLNKV